MRKSGCFLALNAKGKTICLISRKNANFKFLKTPAIIWPAKTWSMRRPSARLLYDSCNFHCSQLFPKKWTFQNPEDSSHNFARREASPEAPKVQIPVRFLEIMVFAIFKKTHVIFKTTKNTLPRGPKTCPSRRRLKSRYHYDSWKCCPRFGRESSDTPCPHLRRLATPLHLVPEGLYGVRT